MSTTREKGGILYPSQTPICCDFHASAKAMSPCPSILWDNLGNCRVGNNFRSHTVTLDDSPFHVRQPRTSQTYLAGELDDDCIIISCVVVRHGKIRMTDK